MFGKQAKQQISCQFEVKIIVIVLQLYWLLSVFMRRIIRPPGGSPHYLVPPTRYFNYLPSSTSGRLHHVVFRQTHRAQNNTDTSSQLIEQGALLKPKRTTPKSKAEALNQSILSWAFKKYYYSHIFRYEAFLMYLASRL